MIFEDQDPGPIRRRKRQPLATPMTERKPFRRVWTSLPLRIHALVIIEGKLYRIEWSLLFNSGFRVPIWYFYCSNDSVFEGHRKCPERGWWPWHVISFFALLEHLSHCPSSRCWWSCGAPHLDLEPTWKVLSWSVVVADRLKKCFKKADKNNDKELDWKEFRTSLKWFA